MAGAKPGVHILQLKPITVPDCLQTGSKFIKWDDSCTYGTPVTLRVDPKGYFLYWKDQNKDLDCLDILLIRDSRTGKFAKVPKEGKLKDSLQIGPTDVPLEDKTLTICYGTDMVNLEWVNFVCASKEMVQIWVDELLGSATNLLAQNASALSFLEKAYTKLTLMTGPDGKILVKSIMEMATSNKGDKDRVKKSLEAKGFPSGKNDSIDPQKFSFEDFFNFYHHLCGRTEVDKVFDEIGAKKKPYVTADQLVQFLNEEQRDPRLNEILYPFYNRKQAQDLIDQFETKTGMAEKGHMSTEGFLKYLMSEENNLIPPETIDLSHDMTQPLSHYLINSSHNTYLTGHQFKGKSSTEMYRQVLLSGCRCIELDCWDGKATDEEPIITHGFTMCTEITFKDVIEAIADSAFKTSDYPVILSFENHCSVKQQVKMALHCRNIFGDMLLTDPIESFGLEPGVPLPSPELLKRKILIKNKKKHFHSKNVAKKSSKSGDSQRTESESGENLPESGKAPLRVASVDSGETGESGSPKRVIDVGSPEKTTEKKEHGTPDRKAIERSPEKRMEMGETFDSESDEESEEEEDDDMSELTEEEERRRQAEKKERDRQFSTKQTRKDKEIAEHKGTAGSEAEAGMEMSELVNYIQPIHFHSFDISEKRNKSYEISSFVETQALSLLKEYPVEFVNYNKRQLSRIYPKGTRVDSGNFIPQTFWNAGCQMVALNFQTLDLSMQINLGIFEYNARSGYILKPDFMRRSDRCFDPFAESTVDGIVAATVRVKVISGQLLSDKKVGTYVEVDMYGLPTDTVRKRFKTKVVPANGINPVYDEEPFVFKKVVLPNLAVIRMAALDDQGKLLGYHMLPVEGLRPGYRHIPLRNESNQPLLLSTLFVHIAVGDFVPDKYQDIAGALMNPIRYLSELEKHASQLAVLLEEFESKEPETDTPRRVDSVKTPRQPITIPREPIPGTVVETPPVSGQDSTNPSAPEFAGPAEPRLPPSENGMPAPPTNTSVSQTSRLNDSENVKPHPLSAIKSNSKAYQKLIAKRDKELETYRKKHEKAREKLKLDNARKEKDLESSLQKDFSSQGKLHTKLSKKASKHGHLEEVTPRIQREKEWLLQDHQQKKLDQKRGHTEVFIAMLKDQYKAELDIYNKHHGTIYDALNQTMETYHSFHMKKLDDIFVKEKQELTNKNESQNKQAMKDLAKKHKDKQELSRIKRESREKHIKQVVQQIQSLEHILEKRKQELQTALNDVKTEFERDKAEAAKGYQKEFETRCEQAMQDPRASPRAGGPSSKPSDKEVTKM